MEEATSRSKPDLIVADPWLGGRYRRNTLSIVKKGHPLVPILLCLAFDTQNNLTWLAGGFLVKRSSTANILQMVEQIMRGTRR